MADGSNNLAPEETILETERVILRKLRGADAEPLAAVLCDPFAMRYFPSPMTRQQVDDWIKRYQERYQEWGFGRWAIIAKESGQVVGNCGLILYPAAGNLEVELGYHVVPQCQGQGFATEAARACLTWAFENTSYERVISFMAIDNLASRRVAERIHSRFLGDCPGAWDRPFCYFDTTRNEFEAQRHQAIE